MTSNSRPWINLRLITATLSLVAAVFSANTTFAQPSPAFTFAAPQGPTNSLVLRATLAFPYGVWDTPALAVPAINFAGDYARVSLEGEPACSYASVEQIRYTSMPYQPNWQYMTLRNDGTWTYNAVQPYFFAFRLRQTAFLNTLSCTIAITLLKAGPTPDETLANSFIIYTGGYAPRDHLHLNGTVAMRSFRVQIPTYCKGVEILKAEIIQNGTYYTATKDAPGSNVFTVNGGALTNVDDIALSLNGPSDPSCVIKVYTRK